ncbi:MAG: ABC transporter [Gammaproteobacteria bacterium]|nr:MAG: ABC transporter [Gammaproteobacteria bacterium]
MPQTPLETNHRMSLRIGAKEKSLLIRAAALEHTNLTDFVIRNVLSAAKRVVEEHELTELTERDSLHVLELLDNPPPPNERLLRAALALPK